MNHIKSGSRKMHHSSTPLCTIASLACFVFTTLAIPCYCQAQFGNMLKRAKQTIVSKTNTRIDQKVGLSVDGILDKIDGKGNRPPAGANSETVSQKPVTNTSDDGSTELSAYKKFDFIPGETIIYSNDFSRETLGESPTGWNSTGGASIVAIDGVEGKWMELSRDAFFLSDNTADFAENFTVEFDLLMRRENPRNIFSQLGFGLMNDFIDSVTHRHAINNYKRVFAAEVKVQPLDYNGSHLHYQSFEKDNIYLQTEIRKFPALQKFINQSIHVSMQVQGERLRVWLNEAKMYDLPHAILPKTKLNQLYFFMKGNGSLGEDPVYDLTNIKIANGIADTRRQLVEEGKFSTTGIQFASNSATVKRESYGVLKEIATVLKGTPTLRIKITGHTDSDGDDAFNLELSKKRAAAVKNIFETEFSIAANRMETDGEGASHPVATNYTPAGKLKNRRVDFVKL